MYKDWKSIPIPAKMQHLEIDKRGFPIPFIVARDKEGTPQFIVNDSRKQLFCKAKKMCAICGKALFKDMWLIGGIQSAFHPNGAYIDTPIHYDCGTYALKVCPYLAMSRQMDMLSKIDRLKPKFGDAVVIVDPTVISERPKCFAFIKITAFKNLPSGYIVPAKPYLAVEYWDSGEQLTKEQGEAIRKELKLL